MNYDVLVVGNPLMDQLAFADDATLQETGVVPGSMSLVGMPDISRLTELTGDVVMAPGGSETNTAVGIAEFGGTVKLLGALADDDLGVRYRADLAKYSNIDADFTVYPSSEYGAGTGTSLVLVSPDGERTMLTYLGASSLLESRCIDKAAEDAAKAVYFDAYLLDLAAGEEIVAELLSYAEANSAKIVFGLADVNAVGRHHDTIVDLAAKADILLANETEIKALAGVSDPLQAVEKSAHFLSQAAVTLGEKGALLYDQGSFIFLDALSADKLVDTTGAGDQFAAGICFGTARGIALKDSAVMGMAAASEVISHMGARPTPGWATFLRAAGS